MAYETLIATGNRGPASGTTPSRQLVVNKQTQIDFRMPMSNVDIDDPTNSVSFEFQLSNDNINWRAWIPSQSWVGGTQNRDRQGNPAPPNCTGVIATPGTYFLRMAYVLNNRMSIGLEWQITEK